MSENIFKEDQKCYKYLDKILNKTLTEKGILLNDIVRETLLNFAISENKILKFINKYYLETQEISIVDGRVYKKKR